MSRVTTVELLLMWCRANDCAWGRACVLDRAAWDARRRSQRIRGQTLPPSDCVLCLTGSGLYEVVNQDHPGDSRYNDLLAWLRQHGLGVQRLSPDYARLYYLNRKEPC
jgi:hypothetical protein